MRTDCFVGLLCLSRSVVIEPLPKARVVALEPSERLVMVPEPNGCVVPVRGLLIELLGGSAAKVARAETRTARVTARKDKRTLAISLASNAPTLRA